MHDDDDDDDDDDADHMKMIENCRVHSEASLTPEILGDTRTTNTRHR